MTIKLNDELAMEKATQGYHIFAYIQDTKDLVRNPYAGDVMLNENAMMNLTNEYCGSNGGCDVFKDEQSKNNKLVKACESALCWLENAPINYSNGVVHQGIDEGNVRGWEGHSDIVDELRNALGIKVDKRGLPLINDSEGDIPF